MLMIFFDAAATHYALLSATPDGAWRCHYFSYASARYFFAMSAIALDEFFTFIIFIPRRDVSFVDAVFADYC